MVTLCLRRYSPIFLKILLYHSIVYCWSIIVVYSQKIFLTLSIKLRLNSLKSSIKLFIIKLLDWVNQTENCVNKCLLILVELYSVPLQVRVEDSLAQPGGTTLVALDEPPSLISTIIDSDFVVLQLLIQVSYFIEELVAVYGKLINDFL